jgi:dTDP-4-dehydrorhamnose 3,5-epimerase
MKLKKLKFEGFYLFNHHVFKDERGFFRRHFCKKDFFKKNLKFDVKQGNISFSAKKGTLRGFHYKSGNSKETKILSCIMGKIFHVAIDLRKSSKTYKKSFSIILNSNKHEGIIIPPKCANAVLTLDKNVLLHYYMTDYFENEKFKGIRYNDPLFKIKWPFKPKIINSRDKNYPNFKF